MLGAVRTHNKDDPCPKDFPLKVNGNTHVSKLQNLLTTYLLSVSQSSSISKHHCSKDTNHGFNLAPYSLGQTISNSKV